MKKILYVASRISHITNFHLPYIEQLKKNNTVHVLSQGISDINVDKIYNINFEKKINSIKNIKTIIDVKKILEQEKYDLIITNTTLASFIVRISKQISCVKNYGKLINIVHGYLFSNNTPFLKKILYILAEKMCVPSTDKIITMNKEDYHLAKKYKLCSYDITNIKGMGIPTPPSYNKEIKSKIRESFDINEHDILLTYAAELSNRKNQISLINSMPKILNIIPNIKLILAGTGELKDYYDLEIKKNSLEDNIFLVGYISPIKELLFSSDIVISSSKSEGLPFNIMEAMSLKIPVMASNVKGHTDLIVDNYNGYLFNDEDELIEKLLHLINNKDIEALKENEYNFIQDYFLENVIDTNLNLFYEFL